MIMRGLVPQGRFRYSATIVLAIFLMPASLLFAQKNTKDTGTDLKFHQFQPSVPPEWTVPPTSQFQGTAPADATGGAGDQGFFAKEFHGPRFRFA